MPPPAPGDPPGEGSAAKEAPPPHPSSLASPDSLQSLSLSALCQGLEQICVPVTAGSTDTPYPDVYPPCFTVMGFPTR